MVGLGIFFVFLSVRGDKRGARLSTERPVPSWHYNGGSISSTRPDSCAFIACPRFVFTRGLFPMPRLR